MYIPKQFEVKDRGVILKLINDYSFGTLFSQKDGFPFATHLPFLVKIEDDEFVLYSHMAKANPHWKQFVGTDTVLTVFQGPHTYISPTWYEETETVPTWNYVAVHLYGNVSLIEDQEQSYKILEEMVTHYESFKEVPWVTNLHNPFNKKLMDMIVFFKVIITHIEGKWKLNQNHSIERRSKVIHFLRKINDQNAKKIADLMEETIRTDLHL